MKLIPNFDHACDRTLNQRTIVGGLSAGAAAGGLLTTLAMTIGLLPVTTAPPSAEWPHAAVEALGLFAMADIAATFFWFAGILIAGVPAWAILSALGVRCLPAAVLLGAVMAPAPFVFIGANNPTGLISFALIGAAVALVTWQIAYREPAVRQPPVYPTAA